MRFKKLGALILGALLTIGVAAGIGATVEKDRVKAAASETQYTLTIDVTSFNTTSYVANNNEKTSEATSSNGKTYDVKWTSYQIMKQSSDMQWQKSKGYMYNSTNLGTINDITITSSAGTFTKYINSYEQPTSNGTGGYFNIKVGSATGKTTKIVITFTITETSTEPDTPTPETQTITPSANTVEVGSSITLTTNADTATWSITAGSENATLSSTVGQEVSLTGTNDGSVTVKAVAEGYTEATVNIAVNPAPFVPNLPTEDEGEYNDATLSFVNTAQRTSIDKSSQVWEQNNITFTNDESGSTTNIADYSNPVRLYTDSKVTVTHKSEKISKIVFVCNSDTYATALNNSIPTGSPTYRSSVSGNNVTVEFARLVSNFVINKLSAQVRLNSLTVTYFEPNEIVETPDLVISGVPNDAKEFKVGQQIELSTGVDETNWSISSNTAKLSDTTGTSVMVTGVDNGKVTITASKDGYNSADVDLTFYYTVNTLTAKAVLVTDVEELAEGDKIIIAAADHNFALSEIQNKNNRSASEDIEKDENIANVGCSVEIITLEKGSVDGTFAFKTDEGYLSADTGENRLLPENTISANSSWLISIDEEGVTTAISQVNGDRNNLRYNNSSKLFSCYAGGQSAISLYRLTGDTDNKEVRVSDNAIDFAQNIYTKQLLDCDQEGINSKINWEQITTDFNKLSNEEKLLIKGVIGDEHGNELEKFISTYDFLVTEKGNTYTDFIGRFESSTKGTYSEFKVFNNDITLIIALVAIVALSGFAFFYVTKRKNKELEF